MTDFEKGQTVRFNDETRAERAAGWGGAHIFRRGDTAEITTVRKHTITVKGTGGYSYNVPRTALATPNGEVWSEPAKTPKPKARKLGEVPEGGISPDDPGLAWLWEDAAKLASRSGYCNYYDRIADELNIPGRKRDVSVEMKVNGVTITATVQARSRKEAEELIRGKLAEPVKVG